MSKKASRSDFRWLLPPDLATVYVPPFSFSWGISHLVVIPCHSHFFPPKNCVKFNQEFASMKIEIQNNPLQERKDWRTLKNPTPWTGQVFTSGAPPQMPRWSRHSFLTPSALCPAKRKFRGGRPRKRHKRTMASRVSMPFEGFEGVSRHSMLFQKASTCDPL